MTRNAGGGAVGPRNAPGPSEEEAAPGRGASEAPPPTSRASARAEPWLHALAGLIVFGVAARLLVRLATAARLADGDTASLLAVETRVAQLLRAGDLVDAARLTWALLAPQPPLGYVPGIGAFTILGARPAGAWVGMALVLAIGAWGLWRLWGPRAWAAGLAILASPMTWTYVEQHGRDVVAGCMLLATLGELHASRGFRARRASFAYGAWLGAGFLTKYTFPMFAVGPTVAAGLVLVAGTLRASREERRARWTNLAIAVGGFLATAGAWYAAHARSVLAYVGFSMSDDLGPQQTANLRDPTTLESVAYYPLALRDALSLPGLAVIGAAVLVGLRARDARARTLLCASAVFSGLAVLSAAPAAIDRYAFPALAALAALLPALLPAPEASRDDPAGPKSGRCGAPRPRPQIPSGGRTSSLARSLHGIVAGLILLAVFLPQFRASDARFAPGAPTRPARFEHPLARARDTAWPIGESYLPTDLDTRAWRLDEIALTLIQAMGTRDGTFGYLGPRVPLNCPSYAQVLLAVAARGGRYDVATVNLMNGPGAPPVFVGPLFDGTSPSGDFDVAVVLAVPPDAGLVEDWLARHPHAVIARNPAPNGGWIGIVRVTKAGATARP